jgi:hypothetical protein
MARCWHAKLRQIKKSSPQLKISSGMVTGVDTPKTSSAVAYVPPAGISHGEAIVRQRNGYDLERPALGHLLAKGIPQSK